MQFFGIAQTRGWGLLEIYAKTFLFSKWPLTSKENEENVFVHDEDPNFL